MKIVFEDDSIVEFYDCVFDEVNFSANYVDSIMFNNCKFINSSFKECMIDNVRLKNVGFVKNK